MSRLERLLPFSKSFAKFMTNSGALFEIFEGNTVSNDNREALRKYAHFISMLPLPEEAKIRLVKARVKEIKRIG